MQFGNFKFFCFFFLFTIATFSQNLEDTIYDAIDSFVDNPTKNALSELNQKEAEFSKLATSKDEQLALVILYCNKGSFEMKNNFQKNAIASYEKAWLLFSNNNLSNYDITEYCLKPLGTLYTKTGNFTLAENIIKKYIFMAEKEHNQPTIISGYINLSIIYKTIGNYKTAIELLQKVEKYKNSSILQKKRIQEELTLNTIGLQKNNNSVDILQNEVVTNAIQSLKTNAFLALKNNNPDVALNYFEKAKVEFLKGKSFEARELAKLYAEEATIYIHLNDTEKAKNCFTKALKTLLPFEKNWVDPKKANLYPENTFLMIFDGLAYLENDTTKKLKWYDLSFYVSDLISDQLVSQEAEIRHQIENRKRTEKCMDLLWNTYQKNKDSNYLELAFQYAEKTKNTVLKERNNQKTLLEQFPNNKDLQLQNQLLSKQESLINEYIRLQITQENGTQLIELNNELASLSIQLKNANNKVNLQFENKTETSFSLTSLKQKLEQDKAQLVYYFWTKEKCYYFYLNTNQVTWNKIDLNEKNTFLLQKFIHFFDNANNINADILAFTSTANTLYQLLGFDQFKKNKNLIIIPDGLLHFVAFDALVTQKSTSKNYSTIPFLVYQNKIAYQTNASFYLKGFRLKKNDKIVGFFPVFKNTNAFLEYSIAESKALEKYEATLFMNEAANRTNFKQNVSQYAIIHLSTHGTSGSFSSPATLVFYDDVMLVNELYGLKNCTPDLVVLSACETGIGKLQKGEGAISIARAFQYAGAKNVLFSLWKINDYATSEIMTNFYDNYTSTHSFFESNYLSKINYLENKSITNAKKSPYYWSAFVYYGAIDANKTDFFYYYVFGMLLLIMLFLTYGRIARFLKRKKV
ncbi:CHAT domain-containing protein [Flavobacterium jejuense]|uniref:CHAT domain-containing protein n=1 Tax=Flavobacterium jejuense TaxID=1544455 RepID=A0ABX0IY86_9FLAO|nr:CHAT domain-containing tetratricopeptide repeat protein [Flavobacterium jejuense]NHN26981.1 CHAT domain-containing protein [Flavobacterium jejuense]